MDLLALEHMNQEIGALHLLIIIAVCLIIGALIGFIVTLVLIQRENKSLSAELDKFRRLYFYEVDKWKNKYKNDDYEAY